METRRDEIRQTEISGTLADIWACNYHNGNPLTLRTSSVGVGFTLASSSGLVPDLTDNVLMCCCGGYFLLASPIHQREHSRGLLLHLNTQENSTF